MKLWNCVFGKAIVLGIASISSAFAQAPEVTSGGVVNAASWSSPVAPGGMVAIFGRNLAGGTISAASPLPYSLGGTSVTMNGIPAPLAFVSPGQINAQVPSAVKTNPPDIDAMTVVVTTAGGTSAAPLASVAAGSPGLFTADGSGCRQASALNITPDGTVSVNSASNSAAPGDYIAVFGTGFGPSVQLPPDGVAATAASPLQTVPGLFFDRKPVAGIQYAGLAPGAVGVAQINFQIPASTRNGCSVPLSASQTLGSPSVTVSVQKGRGQCTEPAIQSWGQLYISKFTSSGFGSVSNFETFSASFPAGPSVQPPDSEEIVFAPAYAANTPVLGGIIRSAFPITQRICPVPGYTNLSAGPILVRPPAATGVTAQPMPVTGEGFVYNQDLPAGSIVPGSYTISGTPGNAVDLKATLTVGSPIQLQTPFAAGTVISSSQPLTVRWTGGDAGTLVRFTLTSGQGRDTRSLYTYADAAAGSLTISPACSGNAGCSFGLPASTSAQVSVQVLPAPDRVTVAVPGVTGPVKLNWQYSWNFSGLELRE